MLYIALNLKDMDIKKLLGLLFEHLENGDIFCFHVFDDEIRILRVAFDSDMVINLNQDILTQYNKIFGYE